VLQGGAEFEDPESYQSKALARTEEQIGIESMSDEKITQYYALYCIYNATNKVPNPITDSDPRFNGIADFPTWLSSTGWEANNIDPCDGWEGITCENGKVLHIDLDRNVMTGAFPPEVTLLASDGAHSTGAGNLERIELYANEFLFNNFDTSWFKLLGSNMKELFFGETSFAGSLSELPPNLEQFDCAFSLIDGGLVDSTFAGLNSLFYAELSGNAYNSSVPAVMGSLPKLENLYIADAFISGDLSYMEGMPSIAEHWIDFNPSLSGPIFPFIGEISTLQSFSVTQSSLTGTIPTELGLMEDMIQMWFYGNQLTGTIPSEIGLLPAMNTFRVESNNLSGSMPLEVCDNVGFLKPLTVLGADCNSPSFDCACCTCCSIFECDLIDISP